MMTTEKMQIMIVAGEASGDNHSAAVVRRLLERNSDVEIFGMGGAELKASGMELTVSLDEFGSVMGLTEVFGSLHKILKAFRILVEAAKKRKPAVAMLVDFPDFNLRLAAKLHRMGIPVVYFIGPSVWAWRKGRIKQIKKYVRKILPIFPFEEQFYKKHGVNVEYVGHPFIDCPKLTVTRNDFLKSNGLNPQQPVIGLLPGSRRNEIIELLPAMLDSLDILRQRKTELQAVLPVAPSIDRSLIEEMVSGHGQIKLVAGQAREVLHAVDAAIVSSGTATVEAALALVPFVVVYRLSKLTYSLGRLLVKGVKYIAMPNLIAGEKIVQELLQDDVNGERIAQEIAPFLDQPEARAKILQNLCRIEEKLRVGRDGRESAASRVASILLEIGSGTVTK